MHALLTGTAASFDDAAYARDLDAFDAKTWRAG